MNEPKLRFPEFKGEWEEKKLGEVAKIQNGYAYDSTTFSYEGDYVIRISDIQNGTVSLTTAVRSLCNVPETFKVVKGDILIAMSGATTGKIGEYRNEEKAYINQRVGNIKPFDINKKILLFLMQSDLFANYLSGILTVGAQPNISSQQISSFPFLLPPSPAEQQKIASCLSAMDDLIAAQAEKVEALKEKKMGLMQQLFPQPGETTPRLRFPEFTGDWEYTFGNELFEPITNKNHNSDLPILALTQDQGAVPREMISYNVIVSDKSVAGYKVVEVDDFIISLRSFQGGIEYSRYKGLCSPAYIVLRKKDKNTNSDFYRIYFKSFNYIQALNKNLEGIRDGKMISYSQFSEIKLPSPSPAEQQKIASCLSALDDQIAAETEKLTALKDYKKGLMQQLFPQPAK